MRPRTELSIINCDHKHFIIKNWGFGDFHELVDDAFNRLKVKLITFSKDIDEILWIETRFYATYLNDEQCKVPFLHSIISFGIGAIIFERELRIFKHTVKRSIGYAVLDQFNRRICEALNDINSLEFRVDIHDDYPRHIRPAPDFN